MPEILIRHTDGDDEIEVRVVYTEEAFDVRGDDRIVAVVAGKRNRAFDQAQAAMTAALLR